MKKSPVQAIDRAFAALELLSKAPEGLKAAEIAERLGLNQTTVHGILKSLSNWNAVHQDPRTGLYKIGIGIYNLAQAYSLEAEIRDKARPLLVELSEEFGETVNLGILSNYQVVTVVESVPERPLTAREIHGVGALPHTQARGKVLLAFGGPSKVRGFRSRFPRLKGEDGGPFDYDAFERELAQVREQGYAAAHHSKHGEVLSFAVPVLNASGEAVAAIGVVVPMVRLAAHDQKGLIRRMREVAAEIQKQLEDA